MLAKDAQKCASHTTPCLGSRPYKAWLAQHAHSYQSRHSFRSIEDCYQGSNPAVHQTKFASKHSTTNHLIVQQARSKSEVPQWAQRAATFTPNQGLSPEVDNNKIKPFRSKLSAYILGAKLFQLVHMLRLFAGVWLFCQRLQ
jgi:hypothetical protein